MMLHGRGFWFLLLAAALPAGAQLLNSTPSRVLGHPQLTLKTANPNWVEGRELFAPQGLAVDAVSGALYISDSGNHRVLAWRSARGFTNGAAADLVIGQRDRFSTNPQGPATQTSGGLTRPGALAVRDQNLYVLDAGNNRVLRFPNPFAQTDQIPDLVIGQTNFTSRTPGLSERLLNLGAFAGGLAFDAGGNLYVADTANRRVLRFRAGDVGAGARNGPAADVVLGQVDFNSNATLPASGLQVKDRLALPGALAFDSRGRLYVADFESATAPRLGGLNRVLVFEAPFTTGKAAARIAGVIADRVDTLTANKTLFAVPQGIAILPNDQLAVADSLSNRILIFPAWPWPEESNATFSPAAAQVAGQTDFEKRQSNAGQAAPTAATLSFPTAMAAVGGELLVADTGNNRVLAFSPPYQSASRVLGQLDFSYDGPNLLEGREFAFSNGSQAAAGIAIDLRAATPHLYIADTLNNRVLGFRDARTAKPGDRADLVIGQPDHLRAQCNYPANNADTPTESSLCRPVGLALDEQGNLYVADSGNARVLRFPAPFAAPRPLPRADLVLGQATYTAKITDPTARTLSFPYGVAVSRNGLLVSDAAHNRVLYFERGPTGFSLGMPARRVFGQPDFLTATPGALENRLNGPLHIAADVEDRLYVADAGNHRVLVFEAVSSAPENARAVVALTAATGGSPLRTPRAVHVAPLSGEIWVGDNTRLVRYPQLTAGAGGAAANFAIALAAPPLAVAQTREGAAYVPDAANRVALYFPGVNVLNAANQLTGRPLAPGAISTVMSRGVAFSEETRVFNELAEPLPLPRALAGVEVLLNDQPVPLLFVSPNQINFIVPMNAPSSGTAELQVARRSDGTILAGGTVEMSPVSPALFTSNASGSGQIAAINEDGTISGPTDPARRGTIVALYGTGHGQVAGAPPDGQLVSGLAPTFDKPRVLINNVPVAEEDVLFSGLAPEAVLGLWQINVRIPETAAVGNAVPVVVQFRGVPSNDPQNPAQPRTTLVIRP
jgi:uncharacterized protein (TIGR03437 family)